MSNLFEQEKVFPDIAGTIDQLCKEKQLAIRDEIIKRLLKNGNISSIAKDAIGKSTKLDSSKKIIGNMVDWFSAEYEKKSAKIVAFRHRYDRKKVRSQNESGRSRLVWAYFPIKTRDTNTPDKIIEEDFNNKGQIFFEGSTAKIKVNAYERSKPAREICLKRFGYICKVCNFDFQKVFGNLGKNYIHVHHTKALSSIGERYEINPEKDLVPICPNCHAMIHRRSPPYEIDELKKILKNRNHSA